MVADVIYILGLSKILLLCLKKIFSSKFSIGEILSTPLFCPMQDHNFLFFFCGCSLQRLQSKLFSIMNGENLRGKLSEQKWLGTVSKNLPVGPQQDASFLLRGISRFQLSLLFGYSPWDVKSLLY